MRIPVLRQKLAGVCGTTSGTEHRAMAILVAPVVLVKEEMVGMAPPAGLHPNGHEHLALIGYSRISPRTPNVAIPGDRLLTQLSPCCRPLPKLAKHIFRSSR